MTWHRSNGSVPSVTESRLISNMEPTEKKRYGSKQAGQIMLFASPQLDVPSLLSACLEKLEDVDAAA